MHLSLLVVVIGLIFFISYLGVHFLIRWTRHNQIIDIPNERSSHSRPIPRGGGLVIVFTTLGAWLIYLLVTDLVPSGSAVVAYIAGSGSIALISWQDDLKSLPNWLRLTVHSGAALLALILIGFWQSFEIPVAGSVEVGLLGVPLTFLWIVGLTNAYNFMDGIDGLAGGQAIVGGLSWAVVGWLSGRGFVVSLGLLLAVTSLGFLVHNWPPARIFMGDVGSAFIGYTFATLPLLMLSSANDVPEVPIAALLFVWPFVFDTGFTLLRRLRNGENIFSAHRSHLYQRLNICGHSHRSVTLLYLALALFNSILGLWWVISSQEKDFIVIIFPIFESFLLWHFVVRQEQKQLSPLSRT